MNSTDLKAIACGMLVVFLISIAGLAIQFPYDNEYPSIGYSTDTPTDQLVLLQHRIDSGEVELQFDAGNGYLASLLGHLEIPIASQILVFSKTSFQTDFVSPQTPRSIYFNDNTYIAWLQGAPALEISAVDSKLGPIFYTLSQKKSESPRFHRENYLCLRCHDSYSLTGGGVPRYIMGSGFTVASGQLASHEGWNITTYQNPLHERWGGWYVTGTHGEQLHMGNLIAEDPADAIRLDLAAGANLTDLSRLIDTAPYLSNHSDIVALMVIEHQVYMQNLITRVNYDTRTTLYKEKLHNRELGLHSDRLSDTTLEHLEDIAEPLVRAMLFVDESPLSAPIVGTSGFTEEFANRGPQDQQGRSLRQLNLTERLFQYRCSYLIYSQAFQALPELTRHYIDKRLSEVLDGREQSKAFDHLSSAERQAISEILEETKNHLSGP